ncbi:hypothetical protein Tco_1213969 [Tanacetum coccineum]
MHRRLSTIAGNASRDRVVPGGGSGDGAGTMITPRAPLRGSVAIRCGKSQSLSSRMYRVDMPLDAFFSEY